MPSNRDPEKNSGSEELFKNSRILKSEEIFAGASEVIISHKKDWYRLMITKAGKLILNK